MSPKNEVIDESTMIIDGLETNLSSILDRKRQNLEHELEERIRREKEESERKIARLEKDFADDKGMLGEFRQSVSEYELSRQTLREDIQGRLGKAVGYQKEIERLTALTMEELNAIDQLSLRLGELRRATEERAAEFRARIEKRFGITLTEDVPTEAPAAETAEVEPSFVPPPPPVMPEPFRPAEPPAAERSEAAPPAAPEGPASERLAAEERVAAYRAPAPAAEMVPDLEIELRKLKKIKQLLENDGKTEPEAHRNGSLTDPSLGRHLNPEPPPTSPEPTPAGPEPATVPEAVGEIKIPELNRLFEDFAKRPPEPVPLRPEAPAPRIEDRPAPKNGLSFQAVFEKLEEYRKTEALDDSNEISYFQKGKRTILDGESVLRSIGQVLDAARKIAVRMAQVGSARDHFFQKQELVNQQEILRKIILRGVKLCENEGAALPSYTTPAMSVSILRDTLDKLTTGNWSNADSLTAFDAYFTGLKENFYRLITPPANYLRSILDELEG
jgi:hypothetical protein